MQRLTIVRLAPEATAATDIQGSRVTVQVPDVPTNVKSLQDLLDWLKSNPDFLAMLIAAFLALLGGLAPPRRAA